MAQTIRSSKPTEDYDPVFIHSRREAIVILCLWIVCLCWTIPYCYQHGYTTEVDPDNLGIVWGMPAWVFWGVLLPWMFATSFTIVFCLFVMRDDDLSAAARALGTERSGQTEPASETEVKR